MSPGDRYLLLASLMNIGQVVVGIAVWKVLAYVGRALFGGGRR